MRSIAAQYATSNKATQLHPTLSESGEASSYAAIQDTEEGTKGGKKRSKQHLQEAATRPTTTVAMTSKQVAPAWCASQLPQAAASVRSVRPRTTLRSSLRNLVRTTPTPSSPS
jgi:hypothetical protein